MYKNLCAEALGISARQSEKIELALTYGFSGIDIDILDMLKRAAGRGLDHASRYVESAAIRVGGFELPVNLQGSDEEFQAGLAELEKGANIAAAVGAKGCWTTVLPASDERPYHENFEFHRRRLAATADVLAGRDLQLGLTFLAAPAHRIDRQFQFIHEAEALLALIKSVGAANVGLALDAWNWHVGGGTVDRLRGMSANQIVTVRLSDLPQDADLATIEEESCSLPCESGAIDQAAILLALAEIGYEGPVAVRSHPSQFAGKTRETIVQDAAAALDAQWDAAGLDANGKLAAAAAES